MSDDTSVTPESSESPSRWLYRAWDSDMAYSLRHAPVAAVSLLVFLVLVISAVLAPWIAPLYAVRPIVSGVDGRLHTSRRTRPWDRRRLLAWNR